MNENGYVGVRTRNRMGGNFVGVVPALLNDLKIRVTRRTMFQISDTSVIGQRAEESRSSSALNTTFWILQGLLAAVFLVAGTTKTGRPAYANSFL